MKITKSRLKQIIKEELHAALEQEKVSTIVEFIPGPISGPAGVDKAIADVGAAGPNIKQLKAQYVKAWKEMKAAGVKAAGTPPMRRTKAGVVPIDPGKEWTALRYNSPERRKVRELGAQLKKVKKRQAPVRKHVSQTKKRMKKNLEDPDVQAAMATRQPAAKKATPAKKAPFPRGLMSKGEREAADAAAGRSRTTSTDVTDPKTGARTRTQTSQETQQGVTFEPARDDGKYIIVTAKHPDGRTAEGRAANRGNRGLALSTAKARARRALSKGK